MVGRTILHYKIIEKLGEGGMGVVYKGEDTKLKRVVAIKFLPSQISYNAEEKQRFEIEAQAAAGLNHPNIATIYSIETADKEMFIVMEYINGMELREKISKSNLKQDEALDIIAQIGEGLEHAHQKGVIHRDIKSSNIMVTSNDRIKIMDFGLAKIKGSDFATRIGTTMGTAAYMSPEQAQGGTSDHRSDLWSMGVILYEMLSGHLPFSGEFEQAIIYSVINNQQEPVSKLNPEIEAEIEVILDKLLTKDKELRFQSATDFLKELKSARSGTKDKSESKNDKTIAVLPFENISSDKETDYFADGLTEELIINLSRIKEVSVVPRITSMLYKGIKKDIKTIGRELNINYIIEGSVRKFNNDLRISVQFINVAKGNQLWGETYKGKLADVFDIQEKVSRQVVDALMLKLTPTEKVVLTKRATENTEAFDLYLRARDFLYRMTKNNIQFAIELFNRAIEADNRYAAAYAGLSESYAFLYYIFERKGNLLEKSIESGLKALMYDPSLSEAYAALALAYYNKGMNDDALTSGSKAIELDANNYIAYWILGRIYHSTDHDEKAIELYKKVISLNPDFYSAYSDLEICYDRLGNKEEYNKTLQTAIAFYPKYLSQHPDDARAHIFFADELAQNGEIEKAKIEGKKAFELSPNDSLMLYNLACLHSHLYKKDDAIEYLGKALAAGYSDYEWLKRDSDLNNIRNEPGFVKLLEGK